ncbi:response regulator transcription factor [Paenibacillus arenilitoris]|uniref:Response regulator n=1 Tax=Paenibacillus arenilitoris TaxID=2772299 RepID=A0A927CFJ2_9BACL|nr:response regulator [Paenibacillus arenilitoris]MBD2867149.1 response regulator [Paenibacillus arenilitoris]
MLNVLIVDDKPAVLAGLRDMIPWPEIGARIVGEARNGKDALAIAMETRPDIVITDIRMPFMDGLQLCESLTREMPHTVKIILSAYEDFGYARSAIGFGVKDYILKPIDYEKIEALTEKIKQIADKKNAARTIQLLMFDQGLQEKLQLAVKNADHGALTRLFDDELPGDDAEHAGLHLNFYLKLLVDLFDHIDRSGLSRTLTGTSQSEAADALRRMENGADRKKYVKSLYSRTAEAIRVRKNSRPETIIELIKAYIGENFADPDLTVYTIADKLNITPGYVGLIFNQHAGEHISGYIAGLRMDKARRLLKDPSLPIQQVAPAAGYADPHYFARAFKKTEGLTPSQYRNLHLNLKG